MERKKSRIDFDLKPTQILVLGFAMLIALGTLLLNLPIASQDGHSIGFIDAFFTATSAVCVTGLVVVNTFNHWTAFGKTVIIIMIQIGGLGFMTITTSLFMILGRKIGLRERMIIQEALNQYSLSGMVRLTRSIIFGTLLIEGVGAILLSIKFVPEYGLQGVAMGIFHSISAFCNAGFDIVGESSLSPYIGDVLVNFTVMLLVILGGLGFTVWIDTINTSKKSIEKGWPIKRWFNHLSLHTKLVYVATSFLIISGFIFFLAVEGFNDQTLGLLSFKDKILGALFQSVTTRTAGFNTMPLDKMTDASKFVSILFMFIGGSPAGTAGGVKTITIVVLLVEVMSIVRGSEDTEAFNRRIPRSTVRRALAVIMISLGVVLTVTTILSLSETGSFMNIFFEAVSAFATVGLTLGQTGSLTTLGKFVISITMFIGRLGPITIAVALSLRNGRKRAKVREPEEKVMVG